MNLYVAYKYSNVADKQTLRTELDNISAILQSFGHKTFILGRDVQNWNNRAHPIHSKLKTMLAELKASEGVFVYINSEALSIGLLIEAIWAKILGKKIVLAVKNGVRKPRFFSWLATETVYFSDPEELKAKLK